MYFTPFFVLLRCLGERHYNSADRYGSSKLANILFTKELYQRCASEGANVIVVSAHPGIISETKLQRHVGMREMREAIGMIMSRSGALSKVMFNEPGKTIKQGTKI